MKKAIIIGATSGIGKELAGMLADDGYRVGITGRRKALLEKLQAEYPERCIIESFDAADTGSVPAHLDSLAQKLDGLDLLIISAGTGDINADLDFSIEKKTIDTNVSAFTAVADWAFTYFERQKRGHLAAITSIGGLRGSREAPAYSASKAYQINYMEGLRQKAAKSGLPLHITDIRPGLVNTAMAKGEGLFWVEDVKKVSRQIYRAIKKEKKIVYVTRRWGVIALIMRKMPNRIFDRL
ncbi:MAG: SDR family NAD(P)-dependent oxidoreductase [Spirochaetota bacterium]